MSGNGGRGSLYEAEEREIYIFGVLRLRGGKPIYFWGVGAEGRETQFVGIVNLRETNPTYCLGIGARGGDHFGGFQAEGGKPIVLGC